MTNGSETASDFDPRRRFVRAREVLWRQLEGEILVRTVSEPDVVGLEGTAVLLWLGLVEPVTADELAADLAAAVDAPVDLVAADVNTALTDLLRRGLVAEVAAEVA